jgi:hypothetical protein
MPILTNPGFDQQNQQLTKRPLYMVWIEGLPDPLTTFLMDTVQVTPGGYGVSGYGTTGYGT